MTRNRMAAVLTVLALFGAACSSGAPQAGDRTRLGGDNDTENNQKKKKRDVLKKAAKIGEKAERAGKGGGTGKGTSARAAGRPPKSSTNSEIDPSLARRTAIVNDAANDARKDGVTPSYAELIEASVIGLGEDFKLTMTFDGDLPSAMPNDQTHMIVAIGITGAEEEEGYSFGAQATPDGWRPYAGGKDDGTTEFPGSFDVGGNRIEMIIPWDYIRGPRRFEWYAASNWFSQIAGTTHYKVDLVPNEGLAKFPN